MDDNELDDILDSALTDFEQESQQQSRKPAVSINSQSSSPQPSSSVSNSGDDPADFDLDEVFNKMSTEEQKMVETLAADMADFLGKLQEQTTGETSSASSSTRENLSFEETIKRTTEKLKQNTQGMENIDLNNSETFEHLMESVYKEAGVGKGEDEEEKMVTMLEKIMEALMSPDILQKPMEELREKYPEWLARNEGNISREEYDRISTQYEYTKKICALYEDQKFPECLPQLIDLMKGMQAYGQPPEEMVQSLSQQGSGGIPNFPGLDNLDPKNCPVQ